MSSAPPPTKGNAYPLDCIFCAEEEDQKYFPDLEPIPLDLIKYLAACSKRPLLNLTPLASYLSMLME